MLVLLKRHYGLLGLSMLVACSGAEIEDRRGESVAAASRPDSVSTSGDAQGAAVTPLPGSEPAPTTEDPAARPPAPIDNTPAPDTVAKNAAIRTTSLRAFEETVYPLVRQYCVSCHAAIVQPNFASANAESAHDALMQTSKVNLTDAGASRLVQRLSADNHNCWTETCGDDADALETAVTTWAERVAEAKAAEIVNAVENSPNSTQTALLRVRDAKPGDTPTAPPGSITMEAESGTLTGAMKVGDDALASGGKFVSVPNGTSGNANFGVIVNNQAVTYTFTVAAAGTYRLWGLVKTPTTNDRNIQVIMDNSATILRWAMAVTVDKWAWDLANNGGTNNNAAAVTFNLAAGQHTLRLAQSQDGALVDRLVLTTDTGENEAGFDPSKFTPKPVKVLTYDLKPLLGNVEGTMVIEIETFDTHSIKVKNPTVTLSTAGANVHLKTVLISVNQKVDPRNATYILVDQTLSGTTPTKLSAAAMVMLLDPAVPADETEIGVQFGVIESVP